MIAYAQPKVNMRAKLLPYSKTEKPIRKRRHRLSGVPNRAGGSPCPGGELCREPQRGNCRYARQAHKRIDNLRFFHPLVNLPFFPTTLGADGRLRKRRKKRTAEDFFLPRCITPIRISATILLHRRFTPRRRGITVPRNIFTCADYPNPAGIADWHSQPSCAAPSCRACGK